jgi:hypothetical protein
MLFNEDEGMGGYGSQKSKLKTINSKILYKKGA